MRWSNEPPSAPSADAPAMDTPVIDRLMIDELVEHIGSDDTAQVLSDAARALPERARRIEANRTNAAMLARAAHDLASTAATAGLIELSSLGQKIEQFCANGELDHAHATALEISAALARALTALDSDATRLRASRNRD